MKFGGQHRGRAAAATEAARLARVGGKSRARVVDPDSERARVRLSMAVLRGREALKRRVSMLGNAHAAAQAIMATAADASERAGVQKYLAVRSELRTEPTRSRHPRSPEQPRHVRSRGTRAA